jgi:hypothetical protein
MFNMNKCSPFAMQKWDLTDLQAQSTAEDFPRQRVYSDATDFVWLWEMDMFRFGVWAVVTAVLTPSVWGQGSTQGSPAQGSSTRATSAPAESGKKTGGKHHHKHHHHHKKQAGATQ